ncbi:MAG: GNAT family N-acetyltransferase [Gemmatimonadaceae bacterium]|nr:GNAT family N-acetyltransferase [Caulobacter sp.]
MTFTPVIRETDKPSLASYQQGLKVLRATTTDAVGPPDNHDFALLITAPGDTTVRGGLWGQSRWGAFYVDMLVVPEDLQHIGMGTSLMQRAETEARGRGCHLMWLDTYAFQARPFYERLGFEVFGQMDGSEPIYPRWFMRKVLA